MSLLLRLLGAPPANPEPPPAVTVLAQRLARQPGMALISSTRAGDEPPPPQATVYAPARAREAARTIISWSRTDPDPQPRPAILTPSTIRRPGAVWTIRSAADVAVADPPPMAPVIPRWTQRPRSALILLATAVLGDVPLGGQEHQAIAASPSAAATSATGPATTAATAPAATSSTTAGRIRSSTFSPAVTSTTGTPGSTSTPGHDTASTGG